MRSLEPALEEAVRYDPREVEIPAGTVIGPREKEALYFTRRFGLNCDLLSDYILQNKLPTSGKRVSAEKDTIQSVVAALEDEGAYELDANERAMATRHGNAALSILALCKASVPVKSSPKLRSRKSPAKGRRPREHLVSDASADATHTPVPGSARSTKRTSPLSSASTQATPLLTVGRSDAGGRSPSATPAPDAGAYAAAVQGKDTSADAVVLASLVSGFNELAKQGSRHHKESSARSESLASAVDTVITEQRVLKRSFKTMREDVFGTLAEHASRLDALEHPPVKKAKSAVNRHATVTKRGQAPDSSTDESEQDEDSEIEEGELPKSSRGQSLSTHTSNMSAPDSTAYTPALLGRAKLDFPKYVPKDGLDLFFSKAERFFKLCGVDSTIWVEYAVNALDMYSEWWEQHVLTAPKDMTGNWEYFKGTMTRFALINDPRATALSKLLDTRQGSLTLPAYCQSFMRLVHDSRTSPDEPWLIPRFLKGLNDAALRRASVSNNGVAWHSITELLQHVMSMTAFEHGSNADAKPSDTTFSGKQKQGDKKGGFKSGKRSFNGNGKREHSVNALQADQPAAKPKKKSVDAKKADKKKAHNAPASANAASVTDMANLLATLLAAANKGNK